MPVKNKGEKRGRREHSDDRAGLMWKRGRKENWVGRV